MKFYSGFGFWNEKELFSEYLEDREFVVAGFSYGAQKALIDAIDSKKGLISFNSFHLLFLIKIQNL
jgi:hypothetical protein